MKFTIPVELRGKCKLFINGVEHELPPEVASIEVYSCGTGGRGGGGAGGNSSGPDQSVLPTWIAQGEVP